MSAEMPLYRCHKEVRAARIMSVADDTPTIVLGLSNGAMVEVTVKWWDSKHGKVGGYYVVYEDGYASFSPAEAFEDGYSALVEVPSDVAKPSAFGVGYEPQQQTGGTSATLTRAEDFEARKMALDMALRAPGLDEDTAIVARAQAFYGFLRGSTVA